MLPTELRRTFDEVAERYEEYRPRYPDALFDSLIHQTHLLPGAELLEIGPGTGQATRAMAARGYTITSVELGEHLAAKARQILQAFPKVEIITAAFEEVRLPSDHYDLIYAATAFHWIKPKVRYVKTAQLLKDSGYMAIIHTEHISDEAGDKFFIASHPIYQKFEPSDAIPRLPRFNELQPPQYDAELFDFVSFTPFRMPIRYTAADFAGLISTYSPTLSLPPEKRTTLLHDLQTLITDHFGDSITRHFAITLTLLRKKLPAQTGKSA